MFVKNISIGENKNLEVMHPLNDWGPTKTFFYIFANDCPNFVILKEVFVVLATNLKSTNIINFCILYFSICCRQNATRQSLSRQKKKSNQDQACRLTFRNTYRNATKMKRRKLKMRREKKTWVITNISMYC